jgi:CHRD domain-containing protein
MRRMTLLILGILLVCGSATTFTDDGGSRRIRVRMSGYEETPLALSTTGNGRFHAQISKDETEIQWELSFGDTEGTVTQSHIHFGARAQTGGISIFLCSNLGNGPVGTQACPASAPEDNPVTGTATAANVIGPAGQGIAAGEFAEVIAAIRAGVAYVNVHSTKYPGGEIRAQFPANDDARDHDHHHD